VIQRRRDLRLLSALLVIGIGVSLAFAMGAFIELQIGLRAPGEDWTSSRVEGPALLNGLYLPSLPVFISCAILVSRRGFLPGWIGVLGVVGLWMADLFFGIGLQNRIDEVWFFLFMSCLCFGLAWAFDLQPGPNHGFWINKMGLLAFFLFTLVVAVDWPRETYLLLLPTGAALILFSVFVRRSAGVSGGALAIAIYIGDWVLDWDNLYVATSVIALFGVLAIYAGIRAHLIEDREDPVTFGW